MENKYRIDFVKVVPKYLNCVMDADRLDSISNLAKEERNIILRKFKYSLSFANSYVKCRADEIAYCSSKYQKLSADEKAVLASNIALDKTKVIEVLNLIDSPSFKLCNLEYYINSLSYFKSNVKPISDMSEAEKVVYSFLTKYTNKLCNLEYYINSLLYFKFNDKPISDMSEAEKVVYSFLTKYTRILINIFSRYFGDVEPHLLINMLNEIISFNPELLDSNKKNTNIVK